LPHFFLGDAMIENVRQIGFWINPEAQLHSVVLSGERLSSLLRTEPSYKPCAPNTLASLAAGNGPYDQNASAPDATTSGNGSSGGSWDRSCSQAKKRTNGQRRCVTWSRIVPGSMDDVPLGRQDDSFLVAAISTTTRRIDAR
jgi:hypothetical protein